MDARILWAAGIFWFFLLENPHAHKIPHFTEGGSWVILEGGGGRANFIFYGRGDSSDHLPFTKKNKERKARVITPSSRQVGR